MKLNRKIERIVTHDKSFHADEVMAIAVLIVFKNFNGEIVRTRDIDILDEAKKDEETLVIDVGMDYNGVNNFDHHHDKDLLSSAGLIWKFVNVSGYKEIDNLISIIDDNDRGIKKADKFSYSWIVSNLNGKIEDSDENFIKAVELSVSILKSMKLKTDKLIEAKEIVKDATKLKKFNDTIFLNKYNNQWREIIHGKNEEYSWVKKVVWFNVYTKQWNIQVPSIDIDVFELNGDKLLQCKDMVFVHANGFFAVAETYEDMIRYLIKNNN